MRGATWELCYNEAFEQSKSEAANNLNLKRYIHVSWHLYKTPVQTPAHGHVAISAFLIELASILTLSTSSTRALSGDLRSVFTVAFILYTSQGIRTIWRVPSRLNPQSNEREESLRRSVRTQARRVEEFMSASDLHQTGWNTGYFLHL